MVEWVEWMVTVKTNRPDVVGASISFSPTFHVGFIYPPKPVLSKACPERSEFTLSVIEGKDLFGVQLKNRPGTVGCLL